MVEAGTDKVTELELAQTRAAGKHRPSRRLLALLLLLFFLSGASGLIYQIAWLKYLNLAFGVTLYAVSTVLAGFMAGLALGSFAGGRVADRVPRPLRLYGLLELLIGAVGLLSPTAFLGLQEAYKGLHPMLPDALLPLSLARFFLAFLLLLVPTSLMGATLPLIVKSPLAVSAGLGRGISLLYALNTFGAMAGTFVAGVFLIGDLGLRGTILVAAGLNGVAGLGAIALDLAAGRLSARAAGSSRRETQPSSSDEAGYGRAVLLAVLIVFGLSGFSSLAYEVIWTRILTFFSNGTTYAFTIMLSTFLLGIAAGSLLINPFINRRSDWLLILAGLEFGIGLTSLLSIRVVGEIYPLLRWVDTLPYVGWLVHSETRFMTAVIALTLLPTTLLLGVAFPIGLRVFSSGKAQVGRRVGTLYAVNVFGSILGSFAAGFVLVPLLGSQRSVTLLALVNWSMVPLLLWPAGRRYSKALKSGLVLATGAALVLLVALSPDMHRRIFESRFPEDRVLWYEEGLENTVSVHRNPEKGLLMFLDGRLQAGDSDHVLGLHLLIGHLPMLLHPNPQEALVIGLGGGATPGAVTQHPARQVDLIELSESVVRAAEFFAGVNHDVLRQPNLRLRVDDGRNYLLLADKKYDVITADIIQPYHVGSGNLYSQDYYRMARKALRPDGMMAQWLGDLTESQYKLIMRTFLAVFPYATLWDEGHLMIGTLQPLRLDPAALRAKFSDQRTREALAVVRLNSAEEVLRLYTAGREEMLRFVGPGPLSTDNQPYNEYFRSIPGGEIQRGVATDVFIPADRFRGDVAEILAR